MRPKKPEHILSEISFHLDQSLMTGIFNWQELGYLDFQNLIELTHAKNSSTKEQELHH